VIDLLVNVVWERMQLPNSAQRWNYSALINAKMMMKNVKIINK